jgi:hypothetical protein
MAELTSKPLDEGQLLFLVAGLGTSLKEESAGDEYVYDSAVVAGDLG